jgi:hypothetical protein
VPEIKSARAAMHILVITSSKHSVGALEKLVHIAGNAKKICGKREQ